MKKIALTISALAVATGAYAQGVINWSDEVNNFSITVWSPQYTGAPAMNTLGNSPIDTPAGTGVYTGTPLPTSGYEIGLYVGTTPSAVATALTSGTPVATDDFSAGYGGWDFSGSLPATVNGLAPGSSVYVALAAWSTATGAPTSYAAALANGDLAGASVVSTGTVELGGPNPPNPPITAGNLAGVGITDFTVGSVPEPSTIALGVMGASAFLMRLRRK